ncbi:MAG TPA: CPBP family intramembrane glutamic endopeptidase [Egibacteraceae bacterium]|nr:CPBP family intramembrane glutamic endopeptidase [Egibacteraceae bacterium]
MPWGVGDAVGVFVVTFLLSVVAGVVISGFPPPDLVPPALVEALFGPLTLVLLGLTTLLWVRARKHGAVRLLTGPRRAEQRDVLLALGIGVGAVLVITLGLGVALALLLQLLGLDIPVVQEELRQAARDPQLAPVFVVSAVLIAPIFEELFFRGMVFPAIAKRLGVWAGIVLSAFVFGFVHLNQAEDLLGGGLLLLRLVPLGILFGWLYHWRGTIVVPIIVHSLFNAASVVLLLIGVG